MSAVSLGEGGEAPKWSCRDGAISCVNRRPVLKTSGSIHQGQFELDTLK